MNKVWLISIAAAFGKAFAAGFYMEIERRLGKTKYGSVLGLVNAGIACIVKKIFNKKGE